MNETEISELNLSNNYVFASVMSDKEICKMFLEKLLSIEIEEIEITQYERTVFAGIESKDIRLDVYVKDKKGKVYDIEMQNQNGSEAYNLAKRTRYYQSVIDTEELREGGHYSELPESYIIFICAFDEFGFGKSKYTFMYKCDEVPGLVLQNEAKLIILSTRGTEKKEELDPEIEVFLHYIENSDAELVSASGSKFLSRVHRRFELIKNEKRDKAMTVGEYLEMEGRMIKKKAFAEGQEAGLIKGREEGLQEGLNQGREEGEEAAKIKMAEKMKAEGFEDSVTARVTGLSEERVAML